MAVQIASGAGLTLLLAINANYRRVATLEKTMRITVADYIRPYMGHRGITPEHIENAKDLLVRVDALLTELVEAGTVDLEVNQATGSLVSGWKNGGWRPQECPEGAPNSSHKNGQGVDVYDPDGDIDSAINDELLAKHGLYREHPAQTRRWCHLTTRPPRSGRRTFYA